RQVARLAQHLALRVEEEDRRVAFDVLLVLLLQLLILLLHLVRRLPPREEADGEEDDVLLGPVLELFGAEDLGMQLLAPPSPVTAGEVGEDDLLLLLGRRDRLLVVGAPLLGDRLLLFGLLLVLLRRRLVVGLAGRLVLRGRHRAARDRLGGEACRCDRHQACSKSSHSSLRIRMDSIPSPAAVPSEASCHGQLWRHRTRVRGIGSLSWGARGSSGPKLYAPAPSAPGKKGRRAGRGAREGWREPRRRRRTARTTRRRRRVPPTPSSRRATSRSPRWRAACSASCATRSPSTTSRR